MGRWAPQLWAMGKTLSLRVMEMGEPPPSAPKSGAPKQLLAWGTLKQRHPA